MSRARCYAAYADAAGNKLSGTSVYVYNPGTTTPISETIYDSFTAGGALANPLTTDANGGVLFYLAAPKRVDLQFQKAGYADFTLRDVQVLPDAADILLLATGGTMGAGATLDLSAMGATTFKPPAAAGAAPATDGALAYDSTAKRLKSGDGVASQQYVTTGDVGTIPAAALAADAQPGVVKIESVTLSVTGPIAFIAIPATYKTLRLVGTVHAERAGQLVEIGILRLNIDDGANYDTEKMTATATTVATTETQAGTSIVLGDIAAAGAEAGSHTAIEIVIPNYRNVADPGFYHTCLCRLHTWLGPTPGSVRTVIVGGTWRSAAVVDAIFLGGTYSNFTAGSSMTLYGEM